jgi:hypothetical protein
MTTEAYYRAVRDALVRVHALVNFAIYALTEDKHAELDEAVVDLYGQLGRVVNLRLDAAAEREQEAQS